LRTIALLCFLFLSARAEDEGERVLEDDMLIYWLWCRCGTR
jgi:hypothetical protein